MVAQRRSQRTIAREARVEGISFLSGLDVALRFRPAPPASGIRFVRTDLPGNPSVPANVRYVLPRQRRTTLRHGEAIVEMVEHVLAALAGLHIDNCTVEINGPETPGCDGSSLAFARALVDAGIVTQNVPREVFTVDKPVTVRDGSSTVTAHPGEGDKLVLCYNLDYGRDTPIGAQSLFLELDPDAFLAELASCRTFLLAAEAKALRHAGIGSRITEADLLIFGPEGPINNPLRYPDECVRHKMLDMVGDLALLGKDIAGHVVAHRSGHQLNAELVRMLTKAGDEVVEDVPNQSSSQVELGITEIMNLLPHRYPFLLVDKVIELEAPRRIVAVKNVTVNEPFFVGHWPYRPIMPGVLILESMAQAAGLLIAQWSDPKTHDAMITAIDDVRVRRPVVPGDQLRLEVQCLRVRSKMTEVKACARVGDTVVAEARMLFAIVSRAA